MGDIDRYYEETTTVTPKSDLLPKVKLVVKYYYLHDRLFGRKVSLH